MKDTPKLSTNQVESYKDFTIQEVQTLLSRQRKWVLRNLEQLGAYQVPGRGRPNPKTGRAGEWRFRRDAVFAYIERHRNNSAANGNGAEQHESVEQIITRVKCERAAAGQSL